MGKKRAHFIRENGQHLVNQRTLFFRRARSEPEKQLSLRRGPFHFEEAKRSDDVAERGGHVFGHAMQQNFLLLNFGIEPLMRDHGLTRFLQHGLLRFEGFAEFFEKQN